MVRNHLVAPIAFIVLFAPAAFAQQPPRPAELPRAVTLSLTEYNRLLDLANRAPQPSTVPPVAAALSSADLRVRVEGAMVRGVFALAGEAFGTGVSRVPLVSGATLTEATSGGRPLPLVAEGNAHGTLVPGPGPFTLALDWGAPLAFAPGRASFTLPVPKSGTARATIEIPGDQADVHLSAGLITRRTTSSGRTIVEATLDPGSTPEVWWSMRDSAPAAAARDLRMLGDVFTLLTLGDSDVRMAALIDIAVVQGEASGIEVRLPAGYEVTSVSGSTLESSDVRDGAVMLRIGDAAARRHQFLIGLERQHDAGSFTLETGLVGLPGVQRERGEVAIEAVGTLELDARERNGMHRVDVRELNPTLQSLARLPLLSAFRYQQSAAAAGLTLDVKRFADSSVLAAVAERAVATTLVTSEGRALTEVALTVQNRAQAFLKVTLPVGAAIVSVEVAGEAAKPVLGVDGTRVPLLRPGFRPAGAYQVTFVYLHAGTPFSKKGTMQMTLPKMDMPVGIVEWEVFVPDGYTLRAIGGNALERQAVAMATGTATAAATPTAPPPPASVMESVTVTVVGQSPAADKAARATPPQAPSGPSQNVINLQRRTAGVLPIRVDVPRAGTSHEFIKPLVVDQETTVSFQYARR